MNNTQEQAIKEFKQWWSTAKYTLKCDEYDAMEIWLASQTNQGEIENSYKIGYQDGFNSRQQEVDKLKSDCQLVESQLGQACVKWRDVAEKRQAEVDELQKKI